MPLSESTWIKTGCVDEIESAFPTFCQFFPDEGIIFSITPTHKEKGYYLVWGCRYKEEGDGRVLTSLYGIASWEEGSYTLHRDSLIWTAPNGKTFDYTLASEDDLPPITLKYRVMRKRELSEANPPE